MSYTSRFFNYFPPPKFLAMPASGVSVSDRSLRYIELEPKKKEFIVRRYGEITIPEGTIVSGRIKNPDALKKVFQELKDTYNIQFVRLALHEQLGYVMRLNIPQIKKSELRNNIELQLEENVPIPPKEAIFDYEEIKCEIIEHTHETHVGVFVMPRAFVEAYVLLLHDAGITPLSFEVEACALRRGATRTGLSIMSAGIIRFTWTIPVGGDLLTRAVANAFGISFEEAQKKKEKEGFKPNRGGQKGQNMAALLSLQTKLLKEEIKRREIFWRTHVAERGEKDDIKKVILCGGEANVPSLSDYLAAGLGIPVVIGNPWLNVTSFDDYIPEISRNQALRYTTAIGMALSFPG